MVEDFYICGLCGGDKLSEDKGVIVADDGCVEPCPTCDWEGYLKSINVKVERDIAYGKKLMEKRGLFSRFFSTVDKQVVNDLICSTLVGLLLAFAIMLLFIDENFFVNLVGIER